MTSQAGDGTEDDVCVGYPEHRGVRETYRGDDGIQWECTICGAESWEDAVTSDGTADDYANLPEGASPNWTIMDETALWSDGTEAVPVDAPLNSCCVGNVCDGTEAEPLSIELPGFVGMFRGGKADLARRAKDIVRGNDGTVCKCPTGTCVCTGRP